jgi:hypothetical protein
VARHGAVRRAPAAGLARRDRSSDPYARGAPARADARRGLRNRLSHPAPPRRDHRARPERIDARARPGEGSGGAVRPGGMRWSFRSRTTPSNAC